MSLNQSGERERETGGGDAAIEHVAWYLELLDNHSTLMNMRRGLAGSTSSSSKSRLIMNGPVV